MIYACFGSPEENVKWLHAYNIPGAPRDGDERAEHVFFCSHGRDEIFSRER